MGAMAHLLTAMRLASPALPIGGFSYSQGLESAIEHGWVRDEASAGAWIRDCLQAGVGGLEAPLLYRLCVALADGDASEAARLNTFHLATRETRELRAETLQMGWSLLQMVRGLPHGDEAAAIGLAAMTGTQEAVVGDGGHDDPSGDDAEAITLPLAWAIAARAFALPADQALAAWLWAWAENQVMVTLKAVPLGQQAGQRLLGQLTPVLAEVAARAPALPEHDWSNFAPGFAIASSWHETQYSRMFRS